MVVPVQETVVRNNFTECVLGEFKLLVDTNTGYFNATKMCKIQKKRYVRYELSAKSKSIQKLFVSFNGQRSSYSTIKTNASEAGTYCHPIIFLSVAMWCSNKCYVASAIIVSDFFNRNADRRAQFTRLVKIIDVPISQKLVEVELAVDANRWLAIIYCVYNGKKKNLEHYERKYDVLIKELIHCLTHVYGLTKYSDNVLGSDFGHHKYYHPILFLRMTALVSDELYFRTLPIAFASLSSLVDLSQLKQMLMAKSEVPIELSVAVDDTVDTLSNTVTETIDTNVENDDDVVSEDNVSEQQPTHSRAVPENTSTGGACKYIGEVWSSNEDDSTNNSCSKFGDEEKVYKESDMNQIHMEYKTKMDELRNKMRQLERQLSDERNEFEREKKAIEEGTKSRVQQIESVKKLEQEYLEKRWIREKEDVERKLLHDKEENERKLKECELRYQEELDKQVQLKEDEVEMSKQIQQITFTQKFEIMTRKATKERELLSLKLQNEKKDLENEVETLRQKIEVIQLGHSEDETVSRKRRRVNCVLNMSQQGIYKLESVVVIRLLNGDICTFRRQLKSLANVLHKHRQDIQAFECWFLTDNAVMDYNSCKQTLSESDNMKCVTFKNNHIKNLDNNTEIVVRTLHDHLKSMGTIEADVSVLRRLREDSSAVHATSSLMDSCNENDSTKVLLSQVYTIVTNLYKELVTKEKSKNESK